MYTHRERLPGLARDEVYIKSRVVQCRRVCVCMMYEKSNGFRPEDEFAGV